MSRQSSHYRYISSKPLTSCDIKSEISISLLESHKVIVRMHHRNTIFRPLFYSTVYADVSFAIRIFYWRFFSHFILSLHIHTILHLIIIFFNKNIEHGASHSLSISTRFSRFSFQELDSNGGGNKWKEKTHSVFVIIQEAYKASEFSVQENAPVIVVFVRGKLFIFRSFLITFMWNFIFIFQIHFFTNCGAVRVSMKNEIVQEIAHFQRCAVIGTV